MTAFTATLEGLLEPIAIAVDHPEVNLVEPRVDLHAFHRRLRKYQFHDCGE